MDSRVRNRIVTRLEEIERELYDQDTTPLMAADLLEEKDDLLYRLQTDSDEWNCVDFYEPDPEHLVWPRR
jgi:hypothetical protein